MQTRREVLQGLILSIGGATMLSACGGAASVLATGQGSANRFYTERELALVSRISDLIIPRTETPGAKDVNVPGYMDGLMADWANTETRREHRRALTEIDRRLGQAVSGDYLVASDSEAERALRELDAAAFDDNDSFRGYRTFKSYVTQSYFATEQGAVEELRWVAVPGRWQPSVDITN